MGPICSLVDLIVAHMSSGESVIYWKWRVVLWIVVRVDDPCWESMNVENGARYVIHSKGSPQVIIQCAGTMYRALPVDLLPWQHMDSQGSSKE